MRRPLLGIAVAAAVAAAALTALVVMHPFLQVDATIEDDVQATNWGPLALTFPLFTWIGDAKGFVVEVIVFIVILIVNRRAWIFAVAASTTAFWYFALNRLILRPRPTTAQVLHVTEHPGASSFPSGHEIFIVTLTTVLMLGLGYRFLPRRTRPIGWLLVALTAISCAIARVYTGAHWPTDVLASMLIAAGWLAFLVSFRPISDGALEVGAR
jgi:membrane-associated phospholipid phosphatase